MSQSRYNSAVFGSLRILNYQDNGNEKIINVANPEQPQDVATKSYVDSIITKSTLTAGIGLNLLNNAFNVLPNQTQITALGNINTGMWSGSVINVPYGGTGSTNFQMNKLLLGNGTNSINSISALTFDQNNFTIDTPVIITNLNNGFGNTNGALNILGSTNIAKNLYVSSDTIITGTLSVGNLSIGGNVTLLTINANNAIFSRITSSTINVSTLSVQSYIVSPNSTLSNIYNTNLTSLNGIITNITNTNLLSTNNSSNNINISGVSFFNSTNATNISSANVIFNNSTQNNAIITNISSSNIKSNFGTISILNSNNSSIGNLFVPTILNSINNIFTNITNTNSIITNVTLLNMVLTGNASINNIILTNSTINNLNINNTTNSTTISSGNIYISNSLNSLNIFNTNLSSTNIITNFATIGSLKINSYSIFSNVLLSNLTTNSLIVNNNINTAFISAVQITCANLNVNASTTLFNLNSTNISTNNFISQNSTLSSLLVNNITANNIISNFQQNQNLTCNNFTVGNFTQTGLAILSNVNLNNLTTGTIFVSGLTNSINLNSTNSTINNLKVSIISAGNSFIVNNSIANSFTINSTISNLSALNSTFGSLFVNSYALFQRSIDLYGNYQGINSSSSGSFLTILPSTFNDTVSTSAANVNFWASNFISNSTLSANNPNVITTKTTNLYIQGNVLQGANQTLINNSSLSIGYVNNSTTSNLVGQIMLERSDGNWYNSLYTEATTNKFVLCNASLSGGGGIGLNSINPISFSSIQNSSNLNPITFALFSKTTTQFLSTNTSINNSSGSVVIAGGLGISGNLYTNLISSNYTLTNITEGSSFTIINPLNSGFILNNNTTLSNFSITLPSVAIDGQNLFISSLKQITNITLGNTNINSLSLFNKARFIYVSSLLSWVQN